MPPNVPQIAPKQMMYYWICLRRPANPFAPPQPDPTVVDASGHSTYNPMIVVDALRFPYIEGGGTAGPHATLGTNCNLLEPAVPAVPGRTCRSVTQRHLQCRRSAIHPLRLQRTDGPADYPSTSLTMGNYRGPPANPITQKIYHTIGQINDQSEPWDYFPFNDRDFTSVAELMLVPGCPPGLFTKQFVELAPMPPSTTTTPTSPPVTFPVPAVIPTNPNAAIGYPPVPFTGTPPVVPNAAVAFPAAAGGAAPAGTVAQPHTYPYLVDKFFYSGYGGPVATATIPSPPIWAEW